MQSESHFYRSADGLRLHVRVHDAHRAGRLPVVCLPGLTRNARDFEALAAILSGQLGCTVYAFDYRGRGSSDRDPDWRNYNPSVETRDVIDGLVSLGVQRAAFIGTSRGGLILHLLAQARSDLLEAVVLNDIGPEIASKGLEQIRGYLMKAKQPRSWTEAASIQKTIHGAAFPALDQPDWERMAQALYRERDGGIVLDFDPALVNTLAEIDTSKPLPDLWQQFAYLEAVPLLVVAGEHSKLLLRTTLAQMQERHPQMQSFIAEGQGHAPHLETPDVSQVITDFLSHSGRTWR